MTLIEKNGLASLAEAINASYILTIGLVAATRTKARESIEAALLCGQLLAKAKDDCGHGNWLKWLRENCPDITEKTAQNWMRLANTKHVADLVNAAGLRQAYILAGIIDEGESHTGRVGSTVQAEVERLAVPIGKVRQWFSVRVQQRPIEDWTLEEREATKAQLQPLVEFYQQL